MCNTIFLSKNKLTHREASDYHDTSRIQLSKITVATINKVQMLISVRQLLFSTPIL